MSRRTQQHLWNWTIRAIAIAILTGCSQQQPFVDSGKEAEDFDRDLLKQVSYEEEVDGLPPGAVVVEPPPFALDTDSASIAYWDITLDEAIQTALSNSTVMRDLGARIIQAPELTPTIYSPSLQATDPRFGPEAALSAFDAQLNSRAFFEKNDRVLNNTFLGGGTNFFRQDLWRIENEITKYAATGTQFSLRHYIEDDFNNSPSNIFGSRGQINTHAWTWNSEAEIRQPLLQGAGVEFNRIAGPDAVPGVYNGVLIARVNTEISAADFQLALRDFLSNVENAYWDLVYAYRDLEVRKNVRDRSLQTWQRLQGLQRQELVELDKVAQAAEQYYRFSQEVETALSGRLIEGTRDFNGSTGGTFQGIGGIYVAERRLRLIMGLPINDGRLIRPVTEPVTANVVLNWDQLATGSLAQRTELLQQRLRIRRRGLELRASENFVKPDLDVVGRYRRRGFGDNLYDPHFVTITPPQAVDAGTDEWQIGMELNMPIGLRQGHVAVANAQLALSRERAVLEEMERQVLHDLSNAVAEKTRLFQLMQTAYNRRSSALQQYTVLSSPAVQESTRGVDYDLLLDSERRLAEAEADYYRAVVGYAVALKNVYLEAGGLLQYCNVHFRDTDDGG
ncbi:MAG TPA: TolC family protein [Lacipirellulaceae bacterium]|jgi:outer membrane protein TolC|nr:TolC family protein [Lacipirellulaceae bacterium]